MVPSVTLIRRTSSDMVTKESGHVVRPIIKIPVVRTASPYPQGITKSLLPEDKCRVNNAEVISLLENGFVGPIAVIERAAAVPSHVGWG